jgi:RNAse (barnase) inhibitor barstar
MTKPKINTLNTINNKKINTTDNVIDNVITYNLIAYEDKQLFYDEIEKVLCGGLKSGFGRNLDALNDVFRGGFGILFTHQINKQITHVHIKKSKLLNSKVKTILKRANIYNNTMRDISSLAYDPNPFFWLSIFLD